MHDGNARVQAGREMRGTMKQPIAALIVLVCALRLCTGATWFDALIKMKEAQPDKAELKKPIPLPDFAAGKFTVCAWIKTKSGGTIFAKTVPDSKWVPGGKSLFVGGGRLTYDIGWVGAVRGPSRVADGRWRHVAISGSSPIRIYVDGKLDVEGRLDARPDPAKSVFKVGYTSPNFAPQFKGLIDDVRVYGRVLAEKDIAALAGSGKPAGAGGELAHWSFEHQGADESGSRNHADPVGKVAFADGRFGKALSISSGHMAATCGQGRSPDAKLWRELAAGYGDEASAREMEWERADGIWGADWKTVSYREAAKRYANAALRPTGLAAEIRAAAAKAATAGDLGEVRALYLKSRSYDRLFESLGQFKLKELRATIGDLYKSSEIGRKLVARLDAIEAQAVAWQDGPPPGADFEAWQETCTSLRMDVVLSNNPLIDFDKLVFVKRHTYTANHYYTEFINSRWLPGGNLCVLDLETGKVDELVPELENGVFGRFDVDFDARHIVFAWKAANDQGYRLYEIGIDPETGVRAGELRQLTFPEVNEEEIVNSYRVGYHHGTDDMDPCYLPDGDVVFISTRCQYGILCDAPDIFTTTVLYRLERDAELESRRAGKHLAKLSNSSVSEASPAMLEDGRIMYTRWEYVEKGAVSVKCLWSMNPDGSGSSEVYGNDISLPPTFLYGRPIAGMPSHYVMLGTPHYPQNGMGTVIRLDMTKNIRTREPMTYMTPGVDIRSEGGFHFMIDGNWRADRSGKLGRLFKEPYPLSDKLFLVPCKAEGFVWNDAKAYDICLLDDSGNATIIYDDPDMSCFLPFPLRARKSPPATRTPIDGKMAEKGLATCVVTDIYHGMEDTERGAIKHIRVLEQIPRPWATRRRWGGDTYDQQHATISKNTHLGLRVQHGVVPVEEDGSAHFVVPAGRNIYFQALDEDYMAVQIERTLVNYVPGETRSCIGCHETPNQVTTPRKKSAVMALNRPASFPGPQPGETSGRRPLDFATDVQPVFDKHCIKCHSGEKPKGELNLTGEMTPLFSMAYEQLIEPRRGGFGRKGKPLLCGPTVGENHPKTGNVHYMPARSFGSHASVLVAMLAPGKVALKDPKQAELAETLAARHKKIRLSREELIKITNWVDTNAQFYGMYWGRKNIKYKDHPNFRPRPTFERAASYVSLIPEERR
jgi:hypothetical protein